MRTLLRKVNQAKHWKNTSDATLKPLLNFVTSVTGACKIAEWYEFENCVENCLECDERARP